MRTSKIGPTSVRGEKKLSPYKSNSLLQKIDSTVRDKVTILTQGSSARTSPRSGGQKSKNSGVRFSMADLTRHPNPVFHQDSENYNDIEIEQIEDHATMQEQGFLSEDNNTKKPFFENTATDLIAINRLDNDQTLIDRISKLELEVTNILSRLGQIEKSKESENKEI